jgi:rhodanese-related sulfurtransferase
VARNARWDVIDGEELYRRLATGEPIAVLDVRTETEFQARHIPGSVLIPLQEIDSRASEVPNGGAPIAVVCEYGARSAAACRMLAERGMTGLLDLLGGIDGWPGPVATGMEGNGRHVHPISPEPFLIENFHLLPKGLALDVAMGEGRNAIYLATRGFDVDGVDVDPGAVRRARTAARKLGAPIRGVVGNVEDGTYIIPLDTYDVIAVFNFLHRPLFTDIRDGLRPGGVVIYQTYTTEQQRFGAPSHPAHLLKPGELDRAFGDWEVLRAREEIETSGPGRRPRAIAGIIARKPAES